MIKCKYYCHFVSLIHLSFHVTFFPPTHIQTNTFQAVLSTDGNQSFVLFLYLSDGIQWSTGDSSGGMNGAGGTPALAGYDAGDGVHYHEIMGSLSPSILNISASSNVDVAGLFVFQVGELQPQQQTGN